MQNFTEIRHSFESFYVEKGYGTEQDLDYYCLPTIEARTRPERCGFASYHIKMVNELFAFYMAGFKAGKA